MKKSCKHIDIKNPEIISPFVLECLNRHWRRKKFRRLICRFGFTEDEVQGYDESGNLSFLATAAERISDYVAMAIATHTIPKFLPKASIRHDKTTGKIRLIGSETALQQCFDYVAVYACEEMWRRRFLPQQCSSIKGRGQLYGMRLIRSYIKKDIRATRRAKRNRRRYTPKCKYFAKLDVKKCYPSIDKGILLSKIKHDCGNDDLLYLWEEILKSHGRLNVEKPYAGLLIGALPSQWAAQLMMSFICRYALTLDITHLVTFMDDMVVFGSNRRKLKKSIEKLREYAQDELHMTIKDNWQIKQLGETSVDMMGFVIHANGKVTIRARNFIHSRRLILRLHKRGWINAKSARRLTSYKGFFKYSDSRKVCRNIKVHAAFGKAQKVISREEQNQNDGLLR